MDGDERDPLLPWLPKLGPKEGELMRRRVIQDLLLRTEAWALGRQLKGIKVRPVKEDAAL